MEIGLAVARSITGFDKWLGESGKFENALARVKEFLVPVREWAERASKSLMKFFGIGTGSEAGKFSDFIYGLLSKLSGFNEGYLKDVGFLKSFGLAISNFKKQIQGTAGFKKFTDALKKIKKAFESVIPSIKAFFENLKGKASEKIGDIWGWLSQKIPEGVGKLFDFFAGILDKLAPYIAKIPVYVQKIKDFFASIPDAIQGFLANLPKINDVWESVKQFFSSIFGGTNDDSENAIDSKQKSPFEIGLERLGRIFSKIYDLLPLLAVVGGAALVFAVAAKAIKLVTNLLNAFTTAKYGYKEVQKKDSLPNAILKIAAAIGIIAGSIYLIGSIGDSEFNRAATTVGIIAGALTAITIAFGKIPMNTKGVAEIGDGLMKLSIAIGIIAGIMWLFGDADPSKMVKGGLVVVSIMTLLGIFIAALNKLGVGSLRLEGLLKMSIAVGIIAAIAWIAGNMDGKKALKGLAIVGAIMFMMSKFAKTVGKSGGMVQVKGMLAVAAAVYVLALAVKKLGSMDLATLGKGMLAVVILGGVFAAIAKSFGSSAEGIKIGPIIATALGLVAVIGVFGYVIDKIRDVDPWVMISFAGSLALIVGGLTAAVIAANKLGGGVGGMASGAAGIGAAFAIIAAITTAVVAGLGLIDEATNGGLTSAIEDGGKVLKALIDALTPYDDYLRDGMLAAGLIAGAAIGGMLGPSMIGGAAVVTLALGAIVGIATALVAGLGALNNIPGAEGILTTKITEGGEVLRALGSALAQFGHGFIEVVNGDITDFGNAVAEARSAINGLGYDADAENGGQLFNDLDAAFKFVTAIQTFFASLTPYDTNVTYPELGAYTSAANQLSSDMDLFGTALGTLRTSLTGLSDGMLTDADIQLSIDISSKLHDFFEGIRPYDVQPLSGGGYLTAPGQLSTDMTSFGEAMGVFKENVGRLALDYPILLVSTQLAIGAAGQVFSFFTGLTAEYEKAGAGKISYAQFREKVVTAATDELTELSAAITGYQTRLSGIAESTIEADTEKALKVIGQVSSFLVQANGLAIPTNQNAFQKIFGTKNKVESLFEDVGNLGTSMLTAKEGIATLGAEGSTFDSDFSSAMGALQAMAEFLDGVSGLNIEENKSALQQFFTGETKTETVFDSVGILGDKMKAVGGKIAGLGDGAFEKDFASAMRALNATATFLNRVGELSSTGYLASAGANFENVLFPIENLGDAIGDLAKNAINVDLEKFSGTVEAIMGGYTKVADSMAQFAQFASGSTIQTALNDSIEAFENAGTEMTDGLAGNLDENTVTTAVINLMSAMVDAAGSRIKSFETVGTNCALGLAAGISAGTRFVVNAAESVMKRAISAAKAIADQHSPSKVFAEIGMNNDLGLALGMREYGYVVQAASEDVAQDAIDATGSMINRLSSLVTEDMDTTPTIRPVLDLSDISSGVSTMNGLFGYSQRYTPSMSYNMAQSAASSGYSGRPVPIKADSGSDIINGIRSEIRELRSTIENMQLVTDTGALVGAIGPKMDTYLGQQQQFAMRR